MVHHGIFLPGAFRVSGLELGNVSYVMRSSPLSFAAANPGAQSTDAFDTKGVASLRGCVFASRYTHDDAPSDGTGRHDVISSHVPSVLQKLTDPIRALHVPPCA